MRRERVWKRRGDDGSTGEGKGVSNSKRAKGGPAWNEARKWKIKNLLFFMDLLPWFYYHNYRIIFVCLLHDSALILLCFTTYLYLWLYIVAVNDRILENQPPNSLSWNDPWRIWLCLAVPASQSGKWTWTGLESSVVHIPTAAYLYTTNATVLRSM